MNTDDFFSTFKSALTERIASPFWWSFSVSWCLWNYPFILILFSDNTVTDTMALVNTIAYPSTSHKIFYAFLAPLLSALAYIFLYPFPERIFFDFTLKKQRERNASKQQIYGESLLSIDESNQMRIEMRTLKTQFNRQLQELDAENKSLLDEIDRLKNQGASGSIDDKSENGQDQSNEDIESSISEDEIYVLHILSNAGGKAYQENVKGLTQHTSVKLDWIVDNLVRKKLVHRIPNSARGSLLILTENGRDYVVRNNILRS